MLSWVVAEIVYPQVKIGIGKFVAMPSQDTSVRGWDLEIRRKWRIRCRNVSAKLSEVHLEYLSTLFTF